MRWRKQITTQTFFFYGVFQPINGNKSENSAPWSMNVSMMLRTLSMCSGTLASKSETQQLITIDLSAVIVVNGDRLTT